MMGMTNKAAIILSEFSGCNRALGGILKINPFNVDEIAKNIDGAIGMPKDEKE
jgi:trehalose-6-phosphate synthase